MAASSREQWAPLRQLNAKLQEKYRSARSLQYATAHIQQPAKPPPEVPAKYSPAISIGRKKRTAAGRESKSQGIRSATRRYRARGAAPTRRALFPPPLLPQTSSREVTQAAELARNTRPAPHGGTDSSQSARDCAARRTRGRIPGS